MILTKKILKSYCDNHPLVIPKKLEQSILEQLGSASDTHSFSEQDIYEQLRRLLQSG